MQSDKILIIGASGTVGSELTRLLKQAGYQTLEATSQPPKREGQIQINVATGEGVKAAFDQVDRAFLLSPPGFADQYKVLSPLIQEAKRQGLKKIVLMTAMGANADENSPLRRAEIELENSGLSYNIVRPNWFLQNFNTFWVQGIKEQRKIFVPAGDAKVSFIDARDISAVISELIVADKFNNQDFDLSGPTAVDHHQVAQAISNEISEEVTYNEISPEALKEGLVGGGVPVDYAEFLLLIFGFLREGYNAGTTDNVEKILGRKPLALTDYVKDYKDAWNAV